MYYIALSCILLLARLDLFATCAVHQSDYTYFLCGLICSPLVECTGHIILTSCATWFVHRFVSQCLGHDPCLFCHGVHLRYRCDFQLVGFYPCFEMSAVVVQFFLVVDGEWVVLVIVDDYSRSCGNCVCICALTCFIVWVAYACIVGCLSSIVETLCSLLQGSWRLLLSLTLDLICLGLRGSLWFTLGSWGVWSVAIEKPCALLLPSRVLNLLCVILMTWFEGELMFYLIYCIFCFFIAFSSYSTKSLCFTCYTGLYLLNYAYHCARMSNNEM
jgi:hypothetical protein